VAREGVELGEAVGARSVAVEDPHLITGAERRRADREAQ
jgi:hypothetical protein